MDGGEAFEIQEEDGAGHEAPIQEAVDYRGIIHSILGRIQQITAALKWCFQNVLQKNGTKLTFLSSLLMLLFAAHIFD